MTEGVEFRSRAMDLRRKSRFKAGTLVLRRNVDAMRLTEQYFPRGSRSGISMPSTILRGSLLPMLRLMLRCAHVTTCDVNPVAHSSHD